MTTDITLSEKQLIAIESLMVCKPVSEVAAAAGVSRVTIYRWLKDSDFKVELDKRKNALIEKASRKLTGALDRAIEVLIDLLEAKQPNVRRLAAGNLIDYAAKFSDITDLESRIRALEDKGKWPGKKQK